VILIKRLWDAAVEGLHALRDRLARTTRMWHPRGRAAVHVLAVEEGSRKKMKKIRDEVTGAVASMHQDRERIAGARSARSANLTIAILSEPMVGKTEYRLNHRSVLTGDVERLLSMV